MKKILFLLLTINTFAQVYPPAIPLDEVDVETYILPTSLPEYLEPYTNRYGNTVTRISDVDEFGTNSQRLGHNYSKDQTFNSDQTLIKLAGYPAAILDSQTYEFLYWANIPSYGRWSNTQPNIIYGTSGNTFVSYNINTNSRTTLHVFMEFQSVDFGYGEGNQDFSDRYVGLIGDNYTLIVYDIWNDTYVTRSRPLGNLDWFSVTPSGEYAVAQWRDNNSSSTGGIKRYNIDLTNETHISDYSEHGQFGFLKPEDGGDEVYVQFGNEPQWGRGYSLEMIYIDSAESVDVFYWSPSHGNSGIWGGHISYAQNRAGYFYISEGCCREHGTLPSEVFALDVIENKIERYAKHHANHRVGYGHEAKASVSRDGTKVVFVSNYHQLETESLNSGYAFIVEVPQQTLTNTEFTPQEEKPLITRYFEITGKYLGEETPLKVGLYIQVSTYTNKVESKIIPITQQ